MASIERPDTNNYFRFYGIEQSFNIDTSKLKTLFLEKSRQFHPDFYTHDAEAQNVALAVSAFNNQAYKILGNEISRAQYLVELNLEKEDEKQQLPNSFLMEMMELNEAIDDLGVMLVGDQEADPLEAERFLAGKTNKGKEELRSTIATLKADTLSEIQGKAGEANWHETQIAILKWKYLERLETRMGGR